MSLPQGECISFSLFCFFFPSLHSKVLHGHFSQWKNKKKKSKNCFLPCFCSACLHLCLSVWLGRSYWQRALSLVKPRQHLDRKQRKFSCLFCVGSGWRSDAPAPIRSRCSRCTVMRGGVKFIFMFGALLLSAQVQPQGKKSGKEIAFRKICRRRKKWENNWFECAAILRCM